MRLMSPSLDSLRRRAHHAAFETCHRPDLALPA
jgi:hypothetical protein